ncbi:argininosuccinate lyase [Sagittula sp. M10.9X]|uniref:Argininosuccinate lyase n=1 Tax=Sagittula salina TaxID=2820268 RepID=A0A940S1M7_9RHOB|nr:argininosuccinate lyase [Sagittula salina]
MRLALGLVLAGLVAGCGADGEPTPPEPKEDASGFAVHGTAKMGIAG